MKTSLKSLQERYQREVVPQTSMLYALALTYTHDPSDADDLVQDTLVKAYRHFDQFDEGTNMNAWLCRILTNTFINGYRRKQREHAYIESELAENTPCNQNGAEPTENVEPSLSSIKKSCFYHLSDEVLKALKSISDDFKAILVMADLLDFSYKEIADKLNIPIGTVMSRLCRGRKLMRSMLTDYAATCGYVAK